MSKAKASASVASPSTNQPVVLFGTDENGKPRAARFSSAQSELAIKAAGLSNLHSHVVGSSEVADIAAKLPTGRVYANGRGFVPYVRRDLYAKFVDVIGFKAQPATDASSAAPPGLPQTWDEIGPGHLVLMQASLADGWWEAIVVSRDGDMLTLRYRDYPKFPNSVRNVSAVGLLRPTVPAS